MRFFRCLFSIPFYCLCLTAYPIHAQLHKDSLTNTEREKIINSLRLSGIGHYYKADSFSKSADSSNTALYLHKADPYFLMWIWDNAENIPGELALSTIERKSCQQWYSKFRQAPKSKWYTLFHDMYTEDKADRDAGSNCEDISCMDVRAVNIRRHDSTHFSILYQYVFRNGWPSLKDGSLYAALIAIHDHAHHEFYLQEMKHAGMAGQLTLDVIELVNLWYKQSYSSTQLMAMLNRSDKQIFDISGLLENKMPSALPEIQKVLKEYCPVKLFMTMESKNVDTFTHFFRGLQIDIHKNRDIISRMIKTLSPYCSQAISPYELWHISYIPIEQTQTRLLLYVVYREKPDTLTEKEKKIQDFFLELQQDLPNASIVRKGDTIQVIYWGLSVFDIDQDSIPATYHRSLRRFADILNHHQSIHLDICGHTDRTGSATYNLELSQRRADKTLSLLRQYGMQLQNVNSKGFGDSKPIEDNRNEAGRKKNRRVTFVLYPKPEI